MGKVVHVHLSDPKPSRFEKFKKASCQNVIMPSWANHKKELRIDFLDEFNSISVMDLNCSRKNIEKVLSQYFNTIIFQP